MMNDMKKHLCFMGILYSFQSEYCRISRGAFYSYDYGDGSPITQFGIYIRIAKVLLDGER